MLTLATGGSVLDALKSAAFSFAAMAVTSWISSAMDGLGSGVGGDAGPMRLGGPTGGRVVTESLFVPTSTQLPEIVVRSTPVNVVAQEVAQVTSPGGWWSFGGGQLGSAASAFSGFLASSWEALSRIPGDVSKYAEVAYRRPLEFIHAATGWHPGAGSLAGGVKLGAGVAAIGRAPLHHVMTNKNFLSTSTGGPWSPRFGMMADEAGISLEHAANKIYVAGHSGPHPEAYHRAVYDRLVSVTEGLSGQAYSRAFLDELGQIRTEVGTAGSALNKLVTGR